MGNTLSEEQMIADDESACRGRFVKLYDAR